MLNKHFINIIETYIAEGGLLDKRSKHIVALSGGADSVALLLAMKQLGYDIEAAHCNFHLRGDESDRDERFCSRLCKANNVPLHIVHFDTKTFAQLRHISIEMAARDLRYSYFESLMHDIGAADICVAHHQDDSVETVLMNLIRGTGLHGLKGISPKNGNIIRPMLCVARADIEDALKQAGQDYVTDSTNLIDDVTRNKIRLDILPLMRKINPSVGNAIAKAAEHVARAVNIVDSVISKEAERAIIETDENKTVISSERILSSQSPQDVLFNILQRFSFVPSISEQVYKTVRTDSTGSIFKSSTHSLLVNRGTIVIKPNEKDEKTKKAIKIPEDGLYVYNEGLKFKIETLSAPPSDPTILRDATCCFADASNVRWPLTIRTTQTGDKFVPFGMKGSKLVSDFLTDLKLNLFEKQVQTVLCDAEDKILWITGLRSDNRVRITKSTKETIKITVIKE